MKIKIICENFTISSIITKSIQVKDLIKQIKKSPIINSNGEEIKILNSDQEILNEEDFIKVPENLEKNLLGLSNIPMNSSLNNSSNINSNNNDNNKSINKETSISNNNITKDNTINVLNISDEENKIEYKEYEKRFYLIKYEKFHNKKYSEIDDSKRNDSKKKIEIEELIMKTTNAKTKIDTSKIVRSDRTTTERLNLIDELINSSLGNILNERQNNDNNNNENISQILNILRPIIGNEIDEGEVIINRSNRGPSSIIINRSGHHRVPVAPDENAVNSLKEMGFPEEQCRRALILARNEISRATDILLNGDLDYLPNEK